MIIEGTCRGVEFGEEVCTKAVVRGGSAMGRRVCVIKFGDVCDVGAVQPAVIVYRHEAMKIFYSVVPGIGVESSSHLAVAICSRAKGGILELFAVREDMSCTV